MLLKSIRKSKRIISSFLVINLITELIYPLKAFSSNTGLLTSGGGGPVSASTSSMVDGYTGDFKYSVPLITLPGPNGESVPISINYHAGIGVNQKASWVGLGWDYNPGEISRQVVNAPDDYNGKKIAEMFKNIYKYGALYNNNINNYPTITGTQNYPNYKACDTKTSYRSLTTGERCEMIHSIGNNTGNCYDQQFDATANSNYRFHRHTSPHKSLAYDQYYVSGGISGAIKPYFLGQVNIYPNDKYELNTTLPSANNKKAQFYFENSSRNNIDISETNAYPNPNISYTNADIVNQTTNQIHSGTRVRYFTNLEINTNANLYNNTTNSGFIDYKATTNTGTITTRRTEDNSLIGAFQITDPSGMTYHYSLPVYAFEELNCNEDLSTAGFYFSLIKDKYASSWKLTAVTGPDYQDDNHNYTVDEGDKGYWIGYNYSLWTDDYFWSSQRYGYKTDVSIAQKFVSFMVGGATGNHYSKLISNSNGHVQSYFLNYIQTSTHTAFFVKSVRKDEQSFDDIRYATTIVPKNKALLKLDKIVLLRNEDKALLINTIPLSSSNFDSRFDNNSSSYGVLNDQNFVNISRYIANKDSINNVALKTIDFETNYSLAKKYYGNITNTFTTIANTDYYPGAGFGGAGHGAMAWVDKSWASSTDETNSGKLTLKKINFYDLHAQKITPSIDFGYDESNALKNPDFDKDKTDLWGYYKNDYVNSHYVTSVSKDDVDAWSLKEINTSLGGQIKIQYESDMYNKEGFGGEQAFDPLHYNFDNYLSPYQPISVNIPHLIFPIKNFSGNNITFEDADYGPCTSDVKPLCPKPLNYFSSIFSIYNYINTCGHNAVYYNAGNSSYYPESQKKLIRKGTAVSNSYSCPGQTTTPTYPSTYDGTLYFLSARQEFDFITPMCSTVVGNFSTAKSTGVGIDYHVLFRSYLYGGGVRVKQIDVVDPFKNDTYSQTFTYGAGYCPVVPKAMTLSTSNGPSPYDLNMNTKSLISSSLNSTVGYDNMTQVSVNQNGENAGSIVQTYYNDLVSKPIDIVGKAISRSVIYNVDNTPMPAGGCNLNYYPNPDDYTFRYDIRINLKSSNDQSCRLGQLIKSAILNSNLQEVSSTFYSYGSKYIQERFNFGIQESDDFTFNRVVTWPSNRQFEGCTQGRFSVIARDWYYYNFSDTYTYNSFLIGTSTTRDGITISESTISDPYTGAPTKVVVKDPTQGIFETYTNYAYNNTTSYTAFGLKTINETNRNQLVLPENVKTVKGGKYVISESQVNYTNSYPVRSYNPSSSEYETTTVTKPWYRLNETYSRLLDDDVLITVTPQSTDYRKTSVGTLYDSENNRIEEAGLNQRKTASKWGYNNHYKLADISNANYNSFAFSSFEDQVTYLGATHFGGEITNGLLQSLATIGVPGSTSLIKPHTGTYMVQLQNGVQGPKFYTEQFEIDRIYIAKVWVHKTSPENAALNIQLTGTTGSGALSVTKTVIKSDPLNVIVNDWILMSAEIVVPADFILTSTHSMSVYLTNASGTSGNAYFDDLSFHPKDAVITGNVYNDKTGLLVAQLDNENFATLYDYDEAGRIVATYKEYSGGTKKVTSSLYHFAKP
jgi:hypothetical protein